MTERSTLLQAAQLGVESTPGTPVAANKRLLATRIALNPDIAIGTFRPSGIKFPTLTLPGSEYATGDLEGALSYTDVVYQLASLLGTPAAPTQPDVPNSPTVYEWTFEPTSDQAVAPTTFTVEVGEAVRAHRSAQVVVNEWGYSFARADEDGIELEGAVFGRKLEDGVTLTASPTDVPAVPVLPQHVTGYLDTAFGSLGTTKLTRLLSLECQVAERYSPLWVIDAGEDSYVATYEVEPEVTFTLMVEADAEGMGLLPVARTGEMRFLRVEAVGAVISDDETFRFTQDTAVKVSEVNEFSDEDGVYAIEYQLTAMHDAGWGKALSWSVQNELDAL